MISSLPRLTDADFSRLSRFITDNYGIRLPDSKKTMLESRLHRRLRALKISDFHAYVEKILQSESTDAELILMLDAVTTNKTDFFREPYHFDFLLKKWLPKWKDKNPQNAVLQTWSAGCSTGMEAYTLAMILQEAGVVNYHILASDLSTEVLKEAYLGIYSEDRITPVPIEYRKRYMLRSKSVDQKVVRIVPNLRAKATFQRLNLLDERYPVSPEYMHIVFLRNTLIYFDKQDQETIINRIASHIVPGGLLFLGHSESMVNMKTPFQQLEPTIYQKS